MPGEVGPASFNKFCSCSAHRIEALERFLQEYFDGTLKRYLKSEAIPESNDGPVKVRTSTPHRGLQFLSEDVYCYNVPTRSVTVLICP